MNAPIASGDILIGKYRVERVLGQGGMGVVVAARHVELGQRYAIKFLLPKMLEHPEAIERFLREARAAAHLQSDHIARVHDVGRMENGAPFMVMEYLEGCDLKELLSRDGRLSVEKALDYLRQVCDAIAEAHASNIVHRDLKPANLFLVCRRNGTDCVKVLDFGISKHSSDESVDLTNTDMSLGTPLYMSPEQIAKSKAVDGRSDVWALGVILYELLAGISPFRAKSMMEVIAKVLQEEPPPLQHFRPDIPPEIEAIIARCLRKRREERFPNVEELVKALDECDNSELNAFKAKEIDSTTLRLPPILDDDVIEIDFDLPPQPRVPELLLRPSKNPLWREYVGLALKRRWLFGALGLALLGCCSCVLWLHFAKKDAAAAPASLASTIPAPSVTTTPEAVSQSAPEPNSPPPATTPVVKNSSSPPTKSTALTNGPLHSTKSASKATTPKGSPTPRVTSTSTHAPMKPRNASLSGGSGDIIIEVPPQEQDDFVPPAP